MKILETIYKDKKKKVVLVQGKTGEPFMMTLYWTENIGWVSIPEDKDEDHQMTRLGEIWASINES